MKTERKIEDDTCSPRPSRTIPDIAIRTRKHARTDTQAYENKSEEEKYRLSSKGVSKENVRKKS